MIGRIQREGFDSEGIYFTNAEGMRAGCGRNEWGSSYKSFFIRRRLLTDIGRNPVEPILSSGWPLKSSQSEPIVVCRVCRQLQNTEFTHPPEAASCSRTSSSATPNGCAKSGTQFRQVAVTSWMCQHAARGWLQRLDGQNLIEPPPGNRGIKP